MRISDWSSDVCSSDLFVAVGGDLVFDAIVEARPPGEGIGGSQIEIVVDRPGIAAICDHRAEPGAVEAEAMEPPGVAQLAGRRSEEHTSELQSLMRISYAVFCLKKKNKKTKIVTYILNYIMTCIKLKHT